jgi:hypothetical protein
MQETIDTILSMLRTGMTDSSNDSDDFWVKTWYTYDPLAVPGMEVPAGAVIPAQPSEREIIFPGEDTVRETVYIRFYQPALRKQGEAAETAAGMTRLIAMFEQAELLLRTDPTFGSQFVSSRIVNIEPKLPGVADADAYRIAQTTFQITRRAMWGQ